MLATARSDPAVTVSLPMNCDNRTYLASSSKQCAVHPEFCSLITLHHLTFLPTCSIHTIGLYYSSNCERHPSHIAVLCTDGILVSVDQAQSQCKRSLRCSPMGSFKKRRLWFGSEILRGMHTHRHYHHCLTGTSRHSSFPLHTSRTAVYGLGSSCSVEVILQSMSKIKCLPCSVVLGAWSSIPLFLIPESAPNRTIQASLCCNISLFICTLPRAYHIAFVSQG